ncbi:MAG: MarR family transcriptional regulator [Oscillospiraceae bacterium]|nr:MarR family transcriptional regulator [Oscillospiraceae bacterium]
MESAERDGRHIGFEIRRLSNLIKRNLDHFACEVYPEGATGVQTWMLGYIARESAKGDLFQRDIEKRFNIRRPSATGMLQMLEKNGMITRESVPHDARLKKIMLTGKGRAVAEEMRKKIEAFDAALCETIKPDDLAAFYRVIDRIRDQMEKMEEMGEAHDQKTCPMRGEI